MFVLCFWALLKDADNNSSEVGQDISCTLVNPFGLAICLSLSVFFLCLSLHSLLTVTHFLSVSIYCLLSHTKYKMKSMP